MVQKSKGEEILSLAICKILFITLFIYQKLLIFGMYFQEEQVLPTLVPISKKKKQKQIITDESLNQQVKKKLGLEMLAREKRKDQLQQQLNVPTNEHEIRSREYMQAPKAAQFDERFSKMHEQVVKQQQKQVVKTDKWKEFQKSKSLVTQMMNKINAKNIAQQLYPATNETIDQLTRKIDEQINYLKSEAEKKEQTLTHNINNQTLKNQIQGLKIAIDRSQTIKELYNEKMNLRNKIMTLQRAIISIKEENTNLKIKISHGIQTIQNHMHNLPCERQKQLKQQLNKCQINWKKQKQMRQSLQGNITEIVLNFKRLYEQADTARLIVTRKLAQVQARQKKILTSKDFKIAEQDKQKEQKKSNTKSVTPSAAVETKMRKSTNIYLSDGSSINTPQTTKKTPPALPMSQQTDKKKYPGERPTVGMFSLQDQIKKMRGNQANIIGSIYKQ